MNFKQVLVKSELVNHLNKEKYFPISDIKTGGKMEVSKQRRDYMETVEFIDKFTNRLHKEKKRRLFEEKEIAILRINIEHLTTQLDSMN